MPQISQSLLPHADHHLVVMTPDANNHLRLNQAAFTAKTLFLINQFSPISQAQQDLHQLWLTSLAAMIPLLIHRDEAMAEALLSKQPLGEYRPLSMGAEEVDTLASWCLINLKGNAA